MEMDCGVRIGAERAAGCVVGVGLAPVPCIQATLRSVATLSVAVNKLLASLRHFMYGYV